jgi:hypothetical protein
MSCPTGYTSIMLNNTIRCITQAPQCSIVATSTVNSPFSGASVANSGASVVNPFGGASVANNGYGFMSGGGSGGTMMCPPCPLGGASAHLSLQATTSVANSGGSVANSNVANMCII